jgi:predicted DNA-binding transcriptional regulator AlpA
MIGAAQRNRIQELAQVRRSRGAELSRAEVIRPLSRRSLPERVGGIDQVLSTRDIERITGRHRCTVYRWVCAGTFPPKRAGGGRGWLRSDVERWLNGAGTNQR